MAQEEINSQRVCWDIQDKFTCDVLVIGGGTAGIAAAVACARHGARTVLIERFGCLGGMATTGLVGPFMTSFDKSGREPTVKGIFDELVLRMVELGGAVHPKEVPAGSPYTSYFPSDLQTHHNVTPFDPEIMKYVAQEMLVEAGVEIRFHTAFADTLVKEDGIQFVVFWDKTGLGIGRAKTVIDCSGDGDVGARAGNPFEKGREDGKLQPASMFLRIGGVDDVRVDEWMKAHPGEMMFQSIVAEAKAAGTFPSSLVRKDIQLYRQPRPGEWRINSTRIFDVDGTDSVSLSRGEITGRRQALDLVRFLKCSCPGCENAYLMDTGAQVGIRETRRILGLHYLTKEQVRDAVHFDDAVARYYFFMDLHNPGSGIDQEASQRMMIDGGEYFEIPYGCLVAVKIRNLLMAGRCISTDRYANGAVRVMPACFATGQAAGTAAALALSRDRFPREVDVAELRQVLRQDGCVV